MAIPKRAQRIGWAILDVLPDAITLFRHGRTALRKKKIDRAHRRGGIVAGFRATQKTMRNLKRPGS